MNRVGILGGSFAPVHTGHLNIARQAILRNLVDEVWLLPCRLNPLKEETKMGDEERLALLEKAVEYITKEEGLEGKIRVNDVELHLPAPSYTVNTMRRLQSLYPDIEFRLLIGADSYLEFEKWREHEWLLENFSPIVFPRPGYDTEVIKEGFTLLEGDLQDISSTRIRETRGKGALAEEYMPWTKE